MQLIYDSDTKFIQFMLEAMLLKMGQKDQTQNVEANAKIVGNEDNGIHRTTCLNFTFYMTDCTIEFGIPRYSYVIYH